MRFAALQISDYESMRNRTVLRDRVEPTSLGKRLRRYADAARGQVQAACHKQGFKIHLEPFVLPLGPSHHHWPSDLGKV